MPAFYRRRWGDSNRTRSLERDPPIDVCREGWIVRNKNDRPGLILGAEPTQNDFTDGGCHAVQRCRQINTWGLVTMARASSRRRIWLRVN